MKILIESSNSLEIYVEEVSENHKADFQLKNIISARKSSISLEDSHIISFVVSNVSNVGCGIIAAYLYDLLTKKKVKIKINKENLDLQDISMIEDALKKNMLDSE